MDNRLIALLLVEEYQRRVVSVHPRYGEHYLVFLKSCACGSTDRYKGITGYRLAVKQIEAR